MKRRLLVITALLAACGGAVGSSSSTIQPTDAGTSSASSSGAVSSTGGIPLPVDAAATCSPVGGPYERGKGGGPADCCPGLTEINVQSAATGEDGGPVCAQAPDYVFLCLEGKCGDGICEAPENQPCTCPQDCAGVTTDGG